MSNSYNIAVISCAVLEPEVRHFLRDNPRLRDLVIIPLALHEDPARLQRELQRAVEGAEANPAVEAIVLVFGLCGRGVENLRHARCPIILARAHDCTTLFLGDKDRYAAYVTANPGTYWYNPGFIRGGKMPGPDRDARLREEFGRKFDAEDVEFLIEQDRAGLAHYDRAAYVSLELADTRQDEAYTRSCAACHSWGFDRVPGNPELLQALLRGDWDEKRFLIVPPRHVVRLTADDTIIRAEPESAVHESTPST
jgi:hypothetical protein